MIKKQLMFVAALIFLAEYAAAQTSVGFRGGYSNSSVNYRSRPGAPMIRAGGISAPTYSFLIEHFAQKNAGLQAELQYLTLGYTETDTLARSNQTELSYLKIPLLSSFYFGNTGRFHIRFGPHLGFLMRARDLLRELPSATALPTFGEPDDRPNRFMYGLTAAAGLSKSFGRHTLGGEIRYGYEFGRPETQGRIFDMTGVNLEASLLYTFTILKPRWQK
jgi:hypothetical protein